MKLIPTYLISILIGIIFTSHPPNQKWEVIDKDGSSAFYDLAEDNSGNIIAVGYSNYQSFGKNDMLFCKYNTAGKLIKSNNLGMNREDVAFDIEIASDGNYIISGFRELKNTKEGILLKVDQNFKTIWYKNFKPDPLQNKIIKSVVIGNKIASICLGPVFAHLVISKSNGETINVIKVPELKGQVNDFISYDNNLYLVGNYLQKAFVIKVDMQGNVIWKKRFNRLPESSFSEIHLNAKNQLISVGYTETKSDRKNGYYFICDLDGEKIGSTPLNYGGYNDDLVYTAVLNYDGDLLTAGESLSYTHNAKRKNIFFKFLNEDGSVSKKESDFYSKSSNQNDHVYASILSSTGDLIFAGAKNVFLNGSDALLINYGSGGKPKKAVGTISITKTNTDKDISMSNNEEVIVNLRLQNTVKELRHGISIRITSDNEDIIHQKEIKLAASTFQSLESNIEIPIKTLEIKADASSYITLELYDNETGIAINSIPIKIQLNKPRAAKINLQQVISSAQFYERNQKLILTTTIDNSGEASSGPLTLIVEHKNANQVIEKVVLEPILNGQDQKLELSWDKIKYDNKPEQNFLLKLYNENTDLLGQQSITYKIESEEDYLIRQSDLFVGIPGSLSDEAITTIDSLNTIEVKLIDGLNKIESKSQEIEFKNSDALAQRMKKKQEELEEKAIAAKEALQAEEERLAAERKRLDIEKHKRETAEKERKKAEKQAKVIADAAAAKLEKEKKKAELEQKKLEDVVRNQAKAEIQRKANEEARLKAEKIALEEKEAKRKAKETERIRLADEARLKAEEDARVAEEKRKKLELEKKRLEEEAKKATAEVQRLKDAEAKKKAESEAQRKAEELHKAMAEAQRLAKIEAQRLADEEARQKAEELRQAKEEARRLADEKTQLKAEEEAKRMAEEEAKKAADEKADLEEKLRKKEEERKRLEEEKTKLEEEEKERQKNLKIQKEEAEKTRLKEEKEKEKLKKLTENLQKEKEKEEEYFKDELALQKREMEAEMAKQRAEMNAELARQKAEMEAEIQRIKAEKEKAEEEFIHAVWTESFINRDDKPFISQEPSFRISLIAESDKVLEKNNFKVYINERYSDGAKFDRVKIGKSNKNKKNIYTFSDEVLLEVGMNNIEVFVENESGKTSTGTILVQYSPSKPNLYLYSIGIPHEDLNFTTNDAGDFARAFLTGSKTIFAEQFETILNTAELTEANDIKKTINKLAKDEEINPQITSRDVMVIFVSTHGFTEANELFLKASDWDGYIPDETSVNFRKNILQRLSHIPCKKMIFIDACQSGGGLGSVSGEKDGDDNKWSTSMLDFFSAKSGMKTLFSCGKEEYSYEDDKWQNGAFTEAIIKAVSTDRYKADTNDNKELTIKEIYAYIQKEVPSLIKQKGKTATNQNPVFFEDNSDDYPIILIE